MHVLDYLQEFVMGKPSVFNSLAQRICEHLWEKFIHVFSFAKMDLLSQKGRQSWGDYQRSADRRTLPRRPITHRQRQIEKRMGDSDSQRTIRGVSGGVTTSSEVSVPSSIGWRADSRDFWLLCPEPMLVTGDHARAVERLEGLNQAETVSIPFLPKFRALLRRDGLYFFG